MQVSYKPRIYNLNKRLMSKNYKIKSYYQLSDAIRQQLLEDFSLTSSLYYELRRQIPKGKWWKSDNFLEGFIPYYLSIYVIQQYVKALASNSVLDTFLNDPISGKSGSLADFREYISNPKFVGILSYSLARVKKDNIKEAKRIMKSYPISLSSLAINTKKYLKYKWLIFWIPIQTSLAKLLEHKKWFFKKEGYITNQQLLDLEPHLQKGDILIQRLNFALQNATLPGFWTHALLYAGDGIILEATPPKVRKIAWKKTVKEDYLAVLRPKVSKLDRDKAVNKGLSMVGQPFDYNFDFLSDKSLFCSEFVLKCHPSLTPELPNMYGRLTYPPSNFIQLFNQGKLEFVYFLDGRRKEGRSVLGTPQELAKSHLRSKWDLLQK